MGRAVYIVLSDGPIIIGGYSRANLAQDHASTEARSSVVCIEISDELPSAVIDKLREAAERDEDDTPVTPVIPPPLPPPED